MANMQNHNHLLSSQTERAGHLSTMPALITTRNLYGSWWEQEQIQIQSMCGKTENTVILYSYTLLTHRNFPLSPLYIEMHYHKKIRWALQQRECLNVSIPAHVFNICYINSTCSATSLSVVIFYLLFISVLIGNMHSFILYKFTG